jgi:hypothetical protein
MKKSLLCTVVIVPCAAICQTQTTPEWKVSGSAEAGYTSSTVGREPLGLRQFDIYNRQPRLINLRLRLEYKNTKHGFGATVEPWIGDTADILFRTDPTRSSIAKYTGQAYVSFFDQRGNSIDIGKFTSWIGYESALSADGDQMSRGLLYTIAQPVYHVGARASLAVTPQIGASLFLTRGWNQMERNSRGVTGGAQLRWQPIDKKSSFTLGYIGGEEGDDAANRAGSFGGIGFSNPGSTNVQLVDLIAVFDPDERTHFGLNATYGSAGDPNRGKWYGVALFARRKLSSKDFLALRLESVRDADGVRTGAASTISGITLTYDRTLTSNLSLRLEGRFDHSSTPLFVRDGTNRRDQATLSIGVIMRF